MMFRKKNFFWKANSSVPKKINDLKTIKKILNHEYKEQLNPYDLRILKKKQKILKHKNVKAKVFEEPKDIMIYNNISKIPDNNEIIQLAEMFHNSGFIDDNLAQIKNDEKMKLLNDSKTFKIKW